MDCDSLTVYFVLLPCVTKATPLFPCIEFITPSNKGSGQSSGVFHSNRKFDPVPPSISSWAMTISTVSMGRKYTGRSKYALIFAPRRIVVICPQ